MSQSTSQWLKNLFSFNFLPPSNSEVILLQSSLDKCTTQLQQLQNTNEFRIMHLQSLMEQAQEDLKAIKELIPALLEEASRQSRTNSAEVIQELQSLRELLVQKEANLAAVVPEKVEKKVHEEAKKGSTEIPDWQLHE